MRAACIAPGLLFLVLSPAPVSAQTPTPIRHGGGEGQVASRDARQMPASLPSRHPRQADFTLQLGAHLDVLPASHRGATPPRQAEISLSVTLRLTSHMPSMWLIPTPVQQGPAASYTLIIKNTATGEPVDASFLADARLPPGAPHLAALAPGHSLEVRMFDSPRHFGMLPGQQYTVTAIYQSPVQQKHRRGTPALSAVDGTFSSEPALVSVP